MTPMQAEFNDTIVALATPPGRSGVAVIRLSGPHVLQALRALGLTSLPDARKASLRTLKHPQTGETIDHGLVLYFPAPHSFTGEDVAELQVHGSRAVLSELLDGLTSLDDIRLAEPGEFARRAFHLQKADLVELEGLADLIDAETASQRRQAQRLMEGQLSQRCARLREALLQTLAYLEAFLDFPEEDLPEEALQTMQRELDSCRQEVTALLSGSRQAEIIRDGFRVTLAGIPNAGKSSLLNALLQRNAAIVTDQPGTTRDVLEARLNLRGYLLILNDTAGLRASDDPIEQEGIRRAIASLQDAHLRLWLVDPTQPSEAQLALLQQAQPGDVLVYTKSDISDESPVAPDMNLDSCHLSSETREGIDRLLELLFSRMVLGFSEEAALLTRQRQVSAFERARQHLVDAETQDDLVLKAEEVRLAIKALASVIGIVDVDNILDMVFSSFCLGK